MRKRRVRAFHYIPQIVLVLCGLLAACSSAHGQTETGASTSPDQSEASAETTHTGCLSSNSNVFLLATTTDEGSFVLTGNTTGLEKYVGRELTLEGTRGDDVSVDWDSDPVPSFVVSGIVEVSVTPIPKLDASFADKASWQTERDRQYGVKFAHPATMDMDESSSSVTNSNFVTQEGAEVVAGLDIPRTAYANTNFAGGSFTIYVNPKVTNRESCMGFGQIGSDWGSPEPYTAGALTYTKYEWGNAGMGSWDDDYQFHTFQNGLCYEIAFELGEFNPRNVDTGCAIPRLSRQDHFNLIKPLIAGVSFFRPATPAAQSDGSAETILTGCLSSGDGGFELATAGSDRQFFLTGNTAGFEKYLGRKVTLEGTKDPDTTAAYSYSPLPFTVDRVVRVFEVQVRKPKLDASFTRTASWRIGRSRRYGVKFAHPATANLVDPSEITVETNFIRQEGTEVVARLDIPDMAYANANGAGGSFTIYVNPQVRGRESCMEFGHIGSDWGSPGRYTAGTVTYAKYESGGAAAGTGFYYYDFHTFQNGLCYELAFVLVHSDMPPEVGCTFPTISPQEGFNVIKPLIAGVSFFRPALEPTRASNSHVVPQVTEFFASSQTTDDVANLGLLKFSWKTEGADHVEFTYTCLDPGYVGVLNLLISEDGSSRECSNAERFGPYPSGPVNRSPNSSARIRFGYFYHDDPTDVMVTITPYSHGEAYPAGSDSLTIIVRPHHFPRGVPPGTADMTLVYSPSADGSANYPQGSTLTITWTDAREGDPCVNLYLVQDDPARGERYQLQINGELEIGCLQPASHGSYTWTVPSYILGSGFHVLAGTPGGVSGVLGAPFNIVKPAPNPVQ